MRCIISGHTFTWALEPLERNGTAVPAEMNRSGTGKSGRGRDNVPRGAMIQGSWPLDSSRAARFSTWSFTPPGTVHE